MPGSKPGEIVLYTEVTTSCSHRRDFCPIDLVERRGAIHPDVQRGVLNLIASSPSRKFVVYPHLIGEPLLFPGLMEYLRALTSLPNVELWLCTNGVFLDGFRLHELEESGLRNIWFSMFYATPADYRKHTRSDHFEAARANLDLLLARSSTFDKIHIILFVFKSRIHDLRHRLGATRGNHDFPSKD
jgi:MoaA/NifB/PqqE/SkfB family radical SAM enzyme